MKRNDKKHRERTKRNNTKKGGEYKQYECDGDEDQEPSGETEQAE